MWSAQFPSVLSFGLAPADTDLSTIHTQEATSVPEATEPATVEESSSVQESETVKEGTTGISVQLETYSSGNISIQYPVVSQMNDSAKQDNVNELLKTNALSIIQANDLDETADTLTVKMRSHICRPEASHCCLQRRPHE